MHVSSTEPRLFHQMGELSTLPEKYGCDFLWWVKTEPRGWAGVQRKEVGDLIASMRDGRLGREVKQMRSLRHAMVVVEGRMDVVGELVTSGRSQCPLALWEATLWGLQDAGVKVGRTANQHETGMTVVRFQKWTEKATHGALNRTREPVPRDSWGRSTNKDYQIHLLTGLPGVGDKVAKAVIDHFGKVPWRWTCTEEELCQVMGVGKVKARRMMEALENGTNGYDGTDS